MIHENTDNGVSPVVGVMLMLVVTIIIAAVVSAFAGGFSSTDSTPEMSLSATFSQSNGLIMYHDGGDSLITKDLQVIARKSEEFGHGQSGVNAIVVNVSTIQDADEHYWLNAKDGTYGLMSWRPGEVMYVSSDNLELSGLAVGGYWSSTKSSLTNPDNVGKTFTLEIGYKDGKMIASAPVVVQP